MSDVNGIQVNPLHDFVVIRKRHADGKLKSGLYIPDIAHRNSTLADVLAVGKGKMSPSGRLIPLQVEVGDVVLVDSICGITLDVNGESVVVCRESEIIARVTEPVVPKE